jgi:Uma2 family endonuclease
MTVEVKRYRFTVPDYHRMVEVGILDEDTKVELLVGDVVVREPPGPYHAGTVNRLNMLWTSRLGGQGLVQVQNPIELPEVDSEPQPDLALVRPRVDFYTTAHPRAADVLLAIEVADSSVRLDRKVKIPLYARAGIREVWLVDVTRGRVELYRQPSAAGYREVRVAAADELIAPEAFPDLLLSPRDLLG